ncbi:glycosyltransferase involved in cell wall biosynthesis/O-antigen/teichoic acid export membrane protein [Streptomyces sp. SAI-170]|uniref:glycosyltransferase n=1 Tax=Streptomyces sp. SAI-170 TaxID=3377729 RepID=UPI003C7E5A6E
MTSAHSSVAVSAARPDDVTTVRGARWVTAASLAVGALNYCYALLLTRLLDVDVFATVAAGQGLLLCASTVAAVAIPWVLAQALARAPSGAARRDAARFATVISVLGGTLAGGIVAAVATQFAGPGVVAVLGVTTLLVYLTRVSGGWLQGTERMRTLSCVLTSEAALKVVIGLLFVAALDLGAAGALAAYGVAAVPLLIWWPYRMMSGGGGRWFSPRAHRDLWRRAVELGTVQGLVAAMATVDLVVIALLPADGPATASYQASVMVGRAPLFLAGAISVAFFPALSRRRMGAPLAANAVRMYLIVALPLAAVCATAPEDVLGVLFPSGYETMGRLVMFTAVAGFAIGGVNLVSTFFQAVNDQSCLRRQLLGVFVFLGCALAGWSIAGVRGFASGGAVGALVALLLLVHLLVRNQGGSAFSQLPVLEPVVVVGVLVMLRAVPLVWLIAATATGIVAMARFVGHRESPPAPRSGTSGSQDAGGDGEPVALLLDAVWHRVARPAGDEELRRALTTARRGGADGLLARAYPRQLAGTVAEVKRAEALFRGTARGVTERLRDAGIRSVLVLADGPGDHRRGDLDVMVPDGQWAAAQEVLVRWRGGPERSGPQHGTKPDGPAVRLRSLVRWFGVPVLCDDPLFDRAARADGHPWLEPRPADRLRIRLAHGLFRKRALDLSDLLAIRPLLRADVLADAAREAGREGWAEAHAHALRTAREAIDLIDRGEVVDLPVPLAASLAHGAATAHTGRPRHQGRPGVAAREAALRTTPVPLSQEGGSRVTTPAPAPPTTPGGPAPTARHRLGRHHRQRDRLLVAVSGPDGAGKTTLVGHAASALREHGYTVARTYCHGCVICRRFPGRPRSGQRTVPPSRPRSWAGAAHAQLDAAELALRLAGARLRAAWHHHDHRPAVILTDRGPLDCLAEFAPAPGSRTAALLERLHGAYDLTLLLGADPADSDRAREGCGRPPRTRYRRWADRETNVVRFPGWEARPATDADPALRLIEERAQALRPAPRGSTAGARSTAPRGRVAISIFDDADNADYRGGGSVVVERVARRLAGEFDVTVVTAARHGGTRMRDGVRYRFLPVCRAGPRVAQLLFQAALPFIARRVPHDVWLESFTPPFSTSFLPLFTGRPVVGINQCRGSEVTWRKYHVPTFLVERLGLRLYRHLVVLNDTDAADARRHSPKADVHLIENGVDVPDLDDAVFGAGGHIVYLGRVDMRAKGLDLLLEAYEKAAPDLPLYIAGHGTPAEERKLQAALARTPGDVRWLGYTGGESKEQLLRQSAFMVMPSRYETFGLVALESMAHGKPVIHFALPWLRWMAGKGNVAVPPFDADRLAEEIARLAAHQDVRRALGRQAHRAAAGYTWEAMTGSYLALVRDLLATTAAPFEAPGTAGGHP